MRLKAEEFLGLVQPKAAQIVFKLGTIPSDYVSGRPTILFDGEGTISTRTYPYLDSYTPTGNDRVLVAMVGHSGVVLGDVV